MLDLTFEDFAYFPALRARQAELRALTALDDERLDQILPMLTLSHGLSALEQRRAVDRVGERLRGRPLVLDLGEPPRATAQSPAPLFDDAHAFQAWRSFVSDFDHVVPVLQFECRGERRPLVRQAVLIERVLGRLAFRVRHPETEIEQVLAALDAMDDAGNAVVYLDGGYLRGALFECWRTLTRSLIRLRMAYPDLMVVMLATSFPSSVQQFQLRSVGAAAVPDLSDLSELMGLCDKLGVSSLSGVVAGSAAPALQRGVLEMQERTLHARLGGPAMLGYGDYGALHPHPRPTADGAEWTARIDYPKESCWVFHRRLNDQSRSAYSQIANALAEAEPELGGLDCWGERMILDAAQGEVFARGPAAWLAVRINIHLARQVALSARLSAHRPAQPARPASADTMEWPESSVDDLLEA